MLIGLLLAAFAAACLIAVLVRSRIEAARLRRLDWPDDMTQREMANRTARYFRLHGWRSSQEDGFADIILATTGISVAFLIRSDKLLITDLVDAARERVLGGMPFGILVGFALEDWQREDFRSRSVLLLHYSELPSFLALFDTATETLPPDLHGYARSDQRLSLFMGEKLLKLGRADAGIAWLENAVDLNPRTAQLSSRVLIGAYLAQDKAREAYDVALKAIKWMPDSEHILPTLGDLAIRAGDLGAAEAWTERAIVFDSGNAGLYRRLAQIQRALGKHEAAEQALTKAQTKAGQTA